MLLHKYVRAWNRLDLSDKWFIGIGLTLFSPIVLCILIVLHIVLAIGFTISFLANPRDI